MHLLAQGHSAKRIAQRVGLSLGRLSQLRQQWCKEWRLFTGQGVDRTPSPRARQFHVRSPVAVG
jgi:hypothetical protein